MEKIMRPFVIISLTILMVAVFSTNIFGQRGNPRQSMADRPNMGTFQQWNGDRPMLRIPDLTDEQREQIRDIHLRAQEEGLELRNQLNEQQARLRTLTTGSGIDMDESNGVIEQIGSLRTELMKHRLATRMEVRDLLTDEQKVFFDAQGPFNGNFRGMRSEKRGAWFQRW